MTDTTTSTLNPEETTAFAERCRVFLEANTEFDIRRRDIEAGRTYQAALSEAGLAGLAYATEYGGAGLTPEHDRIFRQVAGGFPAMANDFVISHGMCLPMLNEFGTEEQKKRFMPDNISGTTMWCQMFSEPGAGSDVASLQTKAERDGDEWILNGQKVWTTLARESEYGIIIARTDPEQPKHAGISMFILDMNATGVEIRPIHQIDGGHHFNEIFFTDVRIPHTWLVGEYNNGWRQATAMLMYERVAIGSAGAGKISQPYYKGLRDQAIAAGRIDDPVVRDQLMEIYSMETTKSLVAMRTRAEMKAGKAPGPGGSLGKLFGSIIMWRFREIAMEIAGVGSQAWDPSVDDGALQTQVVGSFSSSIAGGTDEIQRNIIGDRVLGLPRDISVDTGVPFNELKVGTVRS